jgi:hypothetical protein
MTKKFLVLSVMFMVVMLMYGNYGFTQSKQNQPNLNQQQMQSPKKMPNIDDATIDRFLKAAQEIENVKKKYMKEFQTKAEKDMKDILKKYNFDIETYNQIGNSIGQNPELMNKVRQKLNK